MARRVLLVEDHEDTREAFTILLSGWGFDVRSVATGARAIALARRFHPDIAMIDLQLVDMDGCDVARALAESDVPPYLVAVTGHGEARFEARAHEAGFDYFAVKPWSPDAMHSVLAAPQPPRC
jgi:DNA-binding response OmpR family regulator